MDTIDLGSAFIHVVYELLNVTESMRACENQLSKLANITSIDCKKAYDAVVNHLTGKHLFEVRLGSVISPDSCFSTLDLVFEHPNLASWDVCAGNEYFNVRLPSLCYRPKNETAPDDTTYRSRYDPTRSNIAGIVTSLILILAPMSWYCYCRYKIYRYKSLRRRQRMMLSGKNGDDDAEAGSSETRAGTQTTEVKRASSVKEEKNAKTGGSSAEMTLDDDPGKKLFNKVAPKNEKPNKGEEGEMPNGDFMTSES